MKDSWRFVIGMALFNAAVIGWVMWYISSLNLN
jgi:hypothetical protein